MTVNIVIADDHGVLRAGLRAMLSAETDFRVVGEASDGVEALALTSTLAPDVLLADISMPEPNGIEVARAVCAGGACTRVLILTMHEDAGLIEEAREVGAAGFLSKRSVESELIKAIRAVARGDCYWPERANEHSGATAGVTARPLSSLRSDEMRLLALVAQGCSNRDIAAELGVTLEQVEEQRRRLMAVLGLRTRTDLVRYAHSYGLV